MCEKTTKTFSKHVMCTYRRSLRDAPLCVCYLAAKKIETHANHCYSMFLRTHWLDVDDDDDGDNEHQSRPVIEDVSLHYKWL